VVALQKRRIAAADARGLAMIVDPDLDEAYFLAADEVSFEQELELGATIYVEEDRFRYQYRPRYNIGVWTGGCNRSNFRSDARLPADDSGRHPWSWV